MNNLLQEVMAQNPGFYSRVLSDKKEQESSIKYQTEYFTRICKERGYGKPTFYFDRRTGTGANRKGFKELIEDIKAGKIDLLMAKELGRLARNQKVALELKELIESNNIHMITEDGAINTITGDKKMFGLYAWIYEQEAQSTSRRIKMTLETRAKSGLFNGSNAPYGYYQKKGVLYLRDDGSPDVVRQIYKWYIEGDGFDAIAHKLYAKDIPTPSQLAGKKNQSSIWHGSSIRLILQNPLYIGDMVQGRSKTGSEITDKKRYFADEKDFHRKKYSQSYNFKG